jgi:hypothetical protein
MNLELVLLRNIGNFVTLDECKVVARWLCRFPLKGILRSDRVEFLLNYLGLSSFVSYSQCRANEVPSSRTESLEQAGFVASVTLSAKYLSPQKGKTYEGAAMAEPANARDATMLEKCISFRAWMQGLVVCHN